MLQSKNEEEEEIGCNPKRDNKALERMRGFDIIVKQQQQELELAHKKNSMLEKEIQSQKQEMIKREGIEELQMKSEEFLQGGSRCKM